MFKIMSKYFSNKQLMRYQAQEFEPYPIRNAYEKEKEEFIKTVKLFPISELPTKANTVSSHVLYKITHNDVQLLKLKAVITLHKN